MSRKAADRHSQYARAKAIRGGDWGNTAERQRAPRAAITVTLAPVEREMIIEAMQRDGQRTMSSWARDVLVAEALRRL